MQAQTVSDLSCKAALPVQDWARSQKGNICEDTLLMLLFAVLCRFGMKTTCDLMSQVAYNICRCLMQYLFSGRSRGRRVIAADNIQGLYIMLNPTACTGGLV